MTKQIIVTLSSDGSIVTRTAGISGPACLDEMNMLTSLASHAKLHDSRLTTDYERPAVASDITTTNLEDRA